MKYLIIILLTLVSTTTFAAKKKKAAKKSTVVEDKTYQVAPNAPEIAIGQPGVKASLEAPVEKGFRSYWHIELSRTHLSFELPSLMGGAPDFVHNAVGVSVGKKHDDVVFGLEGNAEASAQWQQFERSTRVGPKGEFFQKLNVYQINLFQNFNLFHVFEDSLFVTGGLGIAPMYLTSEQSVYGNSISELGYQVMVRSDFIFPIKKLFTWNTNHLAVDAGIRGSVGSVDSQTFSTISGSLG